MHESIYIYISLVNADFHILYRNIRASLGGDVSYSPRKRGVNVACALGAE